MLIKKLRIQPGTTIVTLNAPSTYAATLGKLPEGASIKNRLQKTNDFIHLFVQNKAELEKKFSSAAAALAPGGLLWISYPKGSSGIQTDLTRDKGWECLETVTLEWLTLISFDDTWSAFLVCNRPPKTRNRASEAYHANQQAIADAKTKTVVVPDDLKKAFSKSKKAEANFEALSFTNRKEYVLWIAGAKREETRTDRVKKTIEKLVAGKKNPTEK